MPKGQQGGRQTEHTFGDQKNSIRETLAFMPADMRRRFAENQRRLQEDAMALERWAANDFKSGSEEL